mgnify:CR=1 FL=1
MDCINVYLHDKCADVDFIRKIPKEKLFVFHINDCEDLPLGILAWAIGGLIMIICAYMFSILATRYAHVNGLVDYAEALMGKRYAYYMAGSQRLSISRP